jgi:membrane associated rhomboid family serine protease
VAVYGLIALNAAVFARELAFANAALRDAFVDAYAVIPFDVTHGVQLPGPAPPTALTLLTSQFVHGSVLHIVSNMLFLAVFGPEIEHVTGSIRFVVLYLLCGVLGAIAQISVMPGSHVPGIGASGAIAGVLGAYIVRFPLNAAATRVPALVVIGLWAAIQFVHGFGTLSSRVLSEQSGGTAYFAHIGGFLSGVFLEPVFVRRRPVRRAPQGRRYRYYY